MMKKIRITALLAAIFMILLCIGCATDEPAETTEITDTVEATDATKAPEVSTEPEVTEPPFPVYEGPSDEFKFTAESVLPKGTFRAYTDFKDIILLRLYG